MAEEQEEQGMSTKTKLAAGAAVGIALPAAVGVARKVIGNGDDSDEQGTPERTTRSGGQSSSSGTSRGAGGTAGSTRARSTSSRRSRSSSGSRSSKRTRASSTTSPRRSGTASQRSASSGRTKEQLYRQAQRLKIEGRSKMSKAQLERAIARARS
jgi:hypothetical protein